MTFKSFLQVPVVPNLFYTYSDLYCVRTDFVVVCFPKLSLAVITGSVPMHFSEVKSSPCIYLLQTWLEQVS